MKNFLKLMCLGMALLMLMGSFVACGKDDAQGDGGNAPAEDGVPRYNGEQLDVLGRKLTSNIMEYVGSSEDAATDAVLQAVYERNERTISALNITTLWAEEPDDSYVNTADIASKAGNTYDVYSCYSLYGATLAMRGILNNLKQYEVMDLSEPWYPAKLVNEATIYDKLYFVTGDVSTNNIFMSSLIYYNKAIYTDKQVGEVLKTKYNYDSIYDLVRDGKWTYDVLFELSANIWADSDNNKEYSVDGGDTYGFATYNTLIDNFYYGAGMSTLKSDPLKGLSLHEDFKNANKITAIVDKVYGFLGGSVDGYNSGDSHVGARTAFDDQRLLFYLAPATHAYTTFRKNDKGLTYGVLPVPKYQAEQATYSACLSFPYSMYGVSSSAPENEAEIAAAYIHFLGKFSYDYTRPVLFEETMKAKYSESVDDRDMWDMVIDAQSYDLGRIFSKQIGQGEPTIQLIRKALASGASGWASNLAGNQKTINDSITALNEQLKALQ